MLYVFGDSYPAGVCEKKEDKAYYIEKAFPELLSATLKIPVYKEAFGGASCMDTINALTSNIHKFKKGDIVILALPHFDRINLPANAYANSAGAVVDRRRREGEPKRKTLVGVPLYNAGLQILSGDYEGAAWFIKFLKTALTPEVYGGTEKGFKYFLNSLIKVHVDLGYGAYENYSNYYIDWATNLSTYFIEKDINYIVYTSHWWAYIKKFVASSCECGHWDERGHTLFSSYLEEFLKSYKHGNFLMLPPDISSVQERYLLGNGPKQI